MQSLTIDMSDYEELDTFEPTSTHCEEEKKKAMVEGAIGATGVIAVGGLFAALVLPMVSLAIPVLAGVTVLAAVERGKEERARK